MSSTTRTPRQDLRQGLPRAVHRRRSQMDPELRRHLRYPEDLFRLQTNMYGKYHITDPADFYQAGDAWNVSQDPGSGSPTPTQWRRRRRQRGSSRSPGTSRMDPTYCSCACPGRRRRVSSSSSPSCRRRTRTGNEPHGVHGGQERPWRVRRAHHLHDAPGPADRRSGSGRRPISADPTSATDLAARPPRLEGDPRQHPRRPARGLVGLCAAPLRLLGAQRPSRVEEGHRRVRRAGGDARHPAAGVGRHLR